MSALPEGARYGVGGMVIDYYYHAFIKTGKCSLLCLGSRLPGFSKWSASNNQDIKNYLSINHNGFSRDPELRLYQKNGFQLLWSIDGYYPDEDSLNYGAMIVRR